MKRPSGCSISQQRIGHGPTQRLSRKISTLRCNAERPSAPHCCANLSSAVPVGMGVTLIICSSIYLDLPPPGGVFDPICVPRTGSQNTGNPTFVPFHCKFVRGV